MINGSKKYQVNKALGETHMVITALDYKCTDNPLTCTIDAGNIHQLAQACCIQDLQVMLNEDCTKQNVQAKIREVGARCAPGDVFIYYYSGHGTEVKDTNGDEVDGMDEAFCFVTPDGQITLESCMVDDDFAKLMTEAIPADVLVLVLTDCCHSGTICDFSAPGWKEHKAVSIAGCLDSQTSGDIGKGGIMTHSLLLAVDKLLRAGETDWSIGKQYNATLFEDDAVFASAQNITIQSTKTVEPECFPWPLIPKGSYKAPLSQAAAAAEAKAEASQLGAASIQALLAEDPQALERLGLSPALVQNVVGNMVLVIPPGYLSKLDNVLPMCFSFVGKTLNAICRRA